MRILLLGHGRMGTLVEALAPEFGCEVAGVLDEFSNDKGAGLTKGRWPDVEVAIDFSTGTAVEDNVRALAAIGMNVVIGTTGWDAAKARLREIVEAVASELQGIRGCVMAIVRYHAESHLLQCLSVGDSRAHLYHLRDAHFFTPTPFVIGDRDLPARRLRVEELMVAPGSVLAMFTDGLESRTNIKGQLDLLRRPAVVIAQHLLENHSRGTDDALVFVARFKKSGAR